MNLAQGEIYWVAFPPSDGREQVGRRASLDRSRGKVSAIPANGLGCPHHIELAGRSFSRHSPH